MSWSVRLAGDRAAAGFAARHWSRDPAALAVVVVAAVEVLCGLLPPPADAATAARTMTYSTEWLGSARADHAGFRRIVAATLADPRGWSLNGRIAFRRVARGGELTIAIASPAAIAGFPSCSAYYSCRVDSHVLINAERWRDATASYRGRALLHAYRQMVINHEVGHALGFGHAGCPRPGGPAPVMQQQSKDLGGCERNPWPLESERAAHAARWGIRAPSPPRPFAPGRRASFVELGARRAEVLAVLGSPRRRAATGRDTRTDSYARPRVVVTYVGGRVTAVSTRSRADVGGGRLAVGRRPDAWMLRDCREGPGVSRCRLRLRGRDPARTMLVLRNGRIALMRVEDEDGARGSVEGSGGDAPHRSSPPSVAPPTSSRLLWGTPWDPSASGRCARWPMRLAASCR